MLRADMDDSVALLKSYLLNIIETLPSNHPLRTSPQPIYATEFRHHLLQEGAANFSMLMLTKVLTHLPPRGLDTCVDVNRWMDESKRLRSTSGGRAPRSISPLRKNDCQAVESDPSANLPARPTRLSSGHPGSRSPRRSQRSESPSAHLDALSSAAHLMHRLDASCERMNMELGTVLLMKDDLNTGRLPVSDMLDVMFKAGEQSPANFALLKKALNGDASVPYVAWIHYMKHGAHSASGSDQDATMVFAPDQAVLVTQSGGPEFDQDAQATQSVAPGFNQDAPTKQSAAPTADQDPQAEQSVADQDAQTRLFAGPELGQAEPAKQAAGQGLALVAPAKQSVAPTADQDSQPRHSVGLEPEQVAPAKQSVAPASGQDAPARKSDAPPPGQEAQAKQSVAAAADRDATAKQSVAPALDQDALAKQSVAAQQDAAAPNLDAVLPDSTKNVLLSMANVLQSSMDQETLSRLAQSLQPNELQFLVSSLEATDTGPARKSPPPVDTSLPSSAVAGETPNVLWDAGHTRLNTCTTLMGSPRASATDKRDSTNVALTQAVNLADAPRATGVAHTPTEGSSPRATTVPYVVTAPASPKKASTLPLLDENAPVTADENQGLIAPAADTAVCIAGAPEHPRQLETVAVAPSEVAHASVPIAAAPSLSPRQPKETAPVAHVAEKSLYSVAAPAFSPRQTIETSPIAPCADEEPPAAIEQPEENATLAALAPSGQPNETLALAPAVDISPEQEPVPLAPALDATTSPRPTTKMDPTLSHRASDSVSSANLSNNVVDLLRESIERPGLTMGDMSQHLTPRLSAERSLPEATPLARKKRYMATEGSERYIECFTMVEKSSLVSTRFGNIWRNRGDPEQYNEATVADGFSNRLAIGLRLESEVRSPIKWVSAASLFHLKSVPDHLLEDQKLHLQLLFKCPPKLFYDINPSDIAQGSSGGCGFVAAVAALAEFPHVIESIFELYTASGTAFQLVLYDPKNNFCRTVVDVNDKVPMYAQTDVDGEWMDWKPCFATSIQNESWPYLVEKAVAKLLGSYSNLNGLPPCLAWAILSGRMQYQLLFPWSTKDISADMGGKWGLAQFLPDLTEYTYASHDNVLEEKQVWGKLKTMISECICSCSFRACSDAEGLIAFHSYSLIALEEVGGFKLVRLRSPWGDEREWTGAWSDNSDMWVLHPGVTVELRQYKGDRQPEGLFYMSFEDFSARVQDVVFSTASFGRKFSSTKPRFQEKSLECRFQKEPEAVRPAEGRMSEAGRISEAERMSEAGRMSEARQSEAGRMSEARQSEAGRQAEVPQSEKPSEEARPSEVRMSKWRQLEARLSEVRQSEAARLSEGRISEARRMSEARQSEAGRMSEARQSEAGRMSEARQSEVRQSEVRQSEVRMSEARQSEVRQSEVRMSDARQSEVRQSEIRMSEARRSTAGQLSDQPDLGSFIQPVLTATQRGLVNQYPEEFTPKDIFRMLCRQNNRELGIDQLRFFTIVNQFRPDLTDSQLEAVWQYCDRNHSDFVEYNEFLETLWVAAA